MADLILSDGILVTARSENQINGLAIVYRRDKQLIISELFAETKDAERTDYILGGAEFGGTKDVQPKGY